MQHLNTRNRVITTESATLCADDHSTLANQKIMFVYKTLSGAGCEDLAGNRALCWADEAARTPVASNIDLLMLPSPSGLVNIT
jgi:hypothetical protein